MSSLTAHRSIVGEPEVVEDGALLPKSSTWHELKAAVSELRTLQAADGSIPKPIKLGGMTRWSKAEIDAFIAQAKSQREAA
mgnify:CR=1 FL=1